MARTPALGAPLALLLSLAAVAPAAAQQVRGHVIDPSAGPLAEATVSFRLLSGADSLAVTTDSLGRFEAVLPRPGAWSVGAGRMGYQDESATVTLVAGQELELLIRLGARALQLPALEVRAVRQALTGVEQVYQRIERMRQLGIGRFLTRSQIEQLNLASVGRVLSAMSSQLRVVESQQMVVNTIFLRGGPRGSCPPAVFIDGFRVNQRPTNVNLLIEPRQIEAIELYTAAAQAPIGFHDPGGCGSVLIWGRRGSSGEGPPHHWRRYLIAGVLVAGALLLFR